MTVNEKSQRLNIEPPLVAKLIGEQFPELSELPIRGLNSMGTENAIYRLGETALIRLPTTDGAARQVEAQ